VDARHEAGHDEGEDRMSPIGTEAARKVLSPTGRLRVGVFPGSPLSMAVDRTSGELHGLGIDLGRKLARRLGVRFEQVGFQRIAEVIEAMKTADVDLTVSNATPARAVHVAFSQTLISIELGYLVPAASPIATISDLDRPGLRVGVTWGSTSQTTLPRLLPHASVVPAENASRAVEMFERRELDLFATNKPTLFAMSDQIPGSRVLDGRWGVEHIALAIPKGRESAMEYLCGFVAEVQSSGMLAEAAERAGLRGVAKAP
jgi:polar amino acid transport system substrate-binding protein